MNVEFQPGKFIPVADFLSRNHSEQSGEPFIDVESHVQMISKSWNISDKHLNDIKAVVRDKPTFKFLTDYIKNGWPKYKNKVDLRLRSYWNI